MRTGTRRRRAALPGTGVVWRRFPFARPPHALSNPRSRRPRRRRRRGQRTRRARLLRQERRARSGAVGRCAQRQAPTTPPAEPASRPALPAATRAQEEGARPHRSQERLGHLEAAVQRPRPRRARCRREPKPAASRKPRIGVGQRSNAAPSRGASAGVRRLSSRAAHPAFGVETAGQEAMKK